MNLFWTDEVQTPMIDTQCVPCKFNVTSEGVSYTLHETHCVHTSMNVKKNEKTQILEKLYSYEFNTYLRENINCSATMGKLHLYETFV